MELDLNVAEGASEKPAAMARSDSGTSDSSVLNAEASGGGGASAAPAEEGSSSTPPPPAVLEFSILRSSASAEGENDVGGADDDEEAKPSPPRRQPQPQPQQLVTRELFPVPPPRGSSGLSKPGAEQVAKVKSRRGPRSRSSQYRGVTFYRRTGRWESHIWDCGKQVYLGGFDTAHAAARAHDRAAIKFRGMGADINFSLGDYDEDMKQMKQLSKEEVVHLLRRRRQTSTAGFNSSRGSYNQYGGRWEAPRPHMGRHCFLGSTNCIYLGLFESQVEAARACDNSTAIKCNGREAVANSDPSIYHRDESETTRLDQLHTQPGVDVDLNLSISQPISDPYGTKRDNYTKPFGGAFNTKPFGRDMQHVWCK